MLAVGVQANYTPLNRVLLVLVVGCTVTKVEPTFPVLPGRRNLTH